MSPAFQGAGIGQHLVVSCKKHNEHVATLRLLTRRVNNVARKFYTEKLDFIESSYQHDGYNAQKHVGYKRVF